MQIVAMNITLFRVILLSSSLFFLQFVIFSLFSSSLSCVCAPSHRLACCWHSTQPSNGITLQNLQYSRLYCVWFICDGWSLFWLPLVLVFFLIFCSLLFCSVWWFINCHKMLIASQATAHIVVIHYTPVTYCKYAHWTVRFDLVLSETEKLLS